MNSPDHPAVGIDLGTTFSVVGHFDKDGRCRTIQNSEGDLTTPSVVFFDREGPIVGKEAVKVAEHEPERIAQFAKREMGKATIRDDILGNAIPPEVVQAVILRKLVDDAALMIGDFSKVVITVPAYFNEPRRKATQDAGRIAGLDVVDIINEPTAAAIAYGVQAGFLDEQGAAREKEVILVYDLGGGTFDVTLMEIDGSNYRALGTAGDVYLGGVDWDQRIATAIADQFQQEHGVDPRNDPAGWQTLMREAEDAKRTLSSRASTMVPYSLDGRRIRYELTRDEFAELTADLVARTIFTTNRLLRECSATWDDVTRILLAGGSSRMPTIQEALEKESGMAVDRSLSPDEAIAHGAAVHAAIALKGAGSPNISIKNVNSHDLGVMGVEKSTGMPRRQVLIPRNTALPATGGGVFRTREVDQINVAIDVVEGGDASGKNSTKIGRFVVGGLPDKLPAGTPIKVRFRYSEDGRLTVRAQLKEVDEQTSMEVDRSVGLNETDIDQWRRKMVANQIIDQPDEASPAASSATAAPVTATPINTEDAYDQLLDPDELDELGEDPDAIEDAAYVNNLEYSGADVLPPIVDTSAAPEAVASPAVVDAADELAAPVIGEPVAQATPVAPDFIPQATPAVAEPVDSVPDQQAEPAAVEPAESAAVEPAGVEPGGDQPAPEGDAAAAQPATNESPAFDWLAEESDSEKASDDDDDLQSFLRNLS